MSDLILDGFINGKLKDKPKMSGLERIALNEAAPEDVELKTSDKVYKNVKKGGAKVADTILGAMVGDAAAEGAKKVNHSISERAIQALNAETNDFWKKYPWLQDGLPAIRKVKEDVGVKPLSTKEILDIMSKMTPEARAEADRAGLAFMNNRVKITEIGKKENALNSKLSKALPASLSVVGFILSPFESFSKAQDKKISRNIKKRVLWNLFATPGENTDFKLAGSIDRMEDDELDSLIQMHINEIKSMYSE